MQTDKNKFREALNKSYSKGVLFSLYNHYFLDWIADGYIGSSLGLFEVSAISMETNKQTFLELMEQFLFDHDTFTTIYEKLPQKVKDIFLEVTWEERFAPENLKEYIIDDGGYTTLRNLQTEFLFFQLKNENKTWFLTLDPIIIHHLRKVMPKPRSYYIHPSKPANYKFFKRFDNSALENLPCIVDFYESGNLKLSSSNKILKESKKNLSLRCKIDEFYQGCKDLDYLRAETLGQLLFLMDEKHLKKDIFAPKNYKDTILKILDGEIFKKEGFNYTALFLNYLKGLRNIWKEQENLIDSLKAFKHILEKFPKDEFVSIDNIIKYIYYHDEFVELVPEQMAFDYLYINEANYGRTKIGSSEKYWEYVTTPFIKSYFFLLVSLGLFDVCYDVPSNDNGLYIKSGYLSKYGGIKFLRLSELGSYILGYQDSYDFAKVNNDNKLFLDNDRLILTITGEEPVKTILFEELSKPITTNKFLFTYESFLKNIPNKEILENKIKEFKRAIGDVELPSIWNEFLEKLLEKTDQVNEVDTFHVINLQNKPKLIKEIMSSETIKGIVLKAENYNLLVRKEDYSTLIKELKKLGYLIENQN